MSDSLRPHGLQHAGPPCPSPTSGVYSNSSPSSRRCHPTISSSVVPFSLHLQSLPHQSLFQWISSLHQVAKVLEFQLEHRSKGSGANRKHNRLGALKIDPNWLQGGSTQSHLLRGCNRAPKYTLLYHTALWNTQTRWVGTIQRLFLFLIIKTPNWGNKNYPWPSWARANLTQGIKLKHSSAFSTRNPSLGFYRTTCLEDLKSDCKECVYNTFPGEGGCRDMGPGRQPEEISGFSNALNGSRPD